MQLPVAWHDLEQGGYDTDLGLWEQLSAGRVRTLEMGAGTGRVALKIAPHEHEHDRAPLVAVERERRLANELRRRASRLDRKVRVVRADALELQLDEQFDLIIAPSAFAQIIGGAAERARLLNVIAAHLAPEGLAALALNDTADHLLCGHDLPETQRRIGHTVLRSTVLPVRSLEDEPYLEAVWVRERVRVRRHGAQRPQRRERRLVTTARASHYAELSAEALAAAAVAAGLTVGEFLSLPSPTHCNSTVLLLGR